MLRRNGKSIDFDPTADRLNLTFRKKHAEICISVPTQQIDRLKYSTVLHAKKLAIVNTSSAL